MHWSLTTGIDNTVPEPFTGPLTCWADAVHEYEDHYVIAVNNPTRYRPWGALIDPRKRHRPYEVWAEGPFEYVAAKAYSADSMEDALRLAEETLRPHGFLRGEEWWRYKQAERRERRRWLAQLGHAIEQIVESHGRDLPAYAALREDCVINAVSGKRLTKSRIMERLAAECWDVSQITDLDWHGALLERVGIRHWNPHLEQNGRGEIDPDFTANDPDRRFAAWFDRAGRDHYLDQVDEDKQFQR